MWLKLKYWSVAYPNYNFTFENQLQTLPLCRESFNYYQNPFGYYEIPQNTLKLQIFVEETVECAYKMKYVAVKIPLICIIQSRYFWINFFSAIICSYK